MNQKKYFHTSFFPGTKNIFCSKQNKTKKFQKKYVFLKNSLFDFLYWRSQKLCEIKKQNIFQTRKGMNQNFQCLENLNFNNTKYFLLEQEKISFQEYWQSSDFQKINNEIQNINKEFQISNPSSKFHYFSLLNNLQKKTNFESVANKFENSFSFNNILYCFQKKIMSI